MIIVTGKNGQLGYEFQQIFKDRTDVLFLDKTELDIANSHQVQSIFATYRPSFVINCAAYTKVDLAETETDLAMKINADALKILSLECNKYQTHLIHFSTDYVFDGTKTGPYIEEDLTNPLNFYGKSKLEGEQNILAQAHSATILRTSWLYSSHGTNFVKTILRLASQKDELKIIFDQHGRPTFAKDLAQAVANNLQNLKNGSVSIYHFANSEETSWYDFAKEIAKEKKLSTRILPIKSKDYPLPTRRPTYSVLSTQKIEEAFNLPIRPWKEALHECLHRL